MQRLWLGHKERRGILATLVLPGPLEPLVRKARPGPRATPEMSALPAHKALLVRLERKAHKAQSVRKAHLERVC
jgi:hypothetical protein